MREVTTDMILRALKLAKKKGRSVFISKTANGKGVEISTLDPRKSRRGLLQWGWAATLQRRAMLPYILLATASTAFAYSVGFTLLALAVFGYIKEHWTGTSQARSAFQTVLIGGLAAAVAFAIARFVS